MKQTMFWVFYEQMNRPVFHKFQVTEIKTKNIFAMYKNGYNARIPCQSHPGTHSSLCALQTSS